MLTKISVICKCPKGHIVSSSFDRKDFSIEYEKVNKDLIDQKIYDFCKDCRSIQILRIIEVQNMTSNY